MHTGTTRLFFCSSSLKPIKLNSTRTQFSLYPLNLYTFPKTSINLHLQSVSVCENALEGKVRIFNAVTNDGSLQEVDEEELVSVELEVIGSEIQFDRVIAEAQQLEESVIIVWMASWCRKCIYLKPKLEKLAADYYSRLRFYCVDVNKVPHKLVARAGIAKMPTIQLWKDCKKQAEVIGGHKAHLVVNEVRQMIENECSM